ncbi:hypothetical protein DFH29DRAFT_1002855 [Suillus ampliporus]|nr:hypothetical protein DFH29DRAFT_1002855 [Suillus ampliporus]
MVDSVKAVDIIPLALPRVTKANARLSTIIACTVSFDDITVAEHITKGTRLTCIPIADGGALEHATIVNGKRKWELREDSEQDDEEQGALEPEAEQEDSA